MKKMLTCENRIVVFLEANPFASRLHVLAPLVTGADTARQECVVVVPHRSAGTDWSAFEQAIPSSSAIVRVDRVMAAPGVMIGSRDFLRLLLGARRFVRPGASVTLVLTAIDDYLLKMPWIVFALSVLFRDFRLIAIRYRVEDLREDARLSLKILAKKTLINLVSVVARPEWVIFDERVPLKQKMHLVPDPWSGPFQPGLRAPSRDSLGWQGDDDIVLLVGRQDTRKGIDIAVEALVLLREKRPLLRVVLIGRIADELSDYERRLADSFGDRFFQIKHYISDSDLATYFSACSVVLLPYHLNFTSTSGVLVRSAASGTPVVGSSHGLIGWRIRRYSLGETFRYPMHEELADQISKVLDAPFKESEAAAYARLSTTESLASRFERIVAGESGDSAPAFP